MDTEKDINDLIKVLNLNLETLFNLKGNFVYAFLNSENKRIQIFSCKQFLQHLSKAISEINTSGEYSELKNDLNKIKICILETNFNDSLRLRQSHWIDVYRNKGYKLYKDITPVKYSIETAVEMIGGKLRYILYLKNLRHDRIKVGIFSKKKELKSFIETHYKHGVTAVVYHESIKT